MTEPPQDECAIESLAGSDGRRQCLDRKPCGCEAERNELNEKFEVESISWERERNRFQGQIEELLEALDRTQKELAGFVDLKRSLAEALSDNQRLESERDALSAAAGAEKARLESRIRDLEKELVGWMESSHNTHRSTLSAERKLEVEFTAHKRQIEIETERKLRADQVRWAKTESVFEAEIQQLKKELHAVSGRRSSLMGRLFGR